MPNLIAYFDDLELGICQRFNQLSRLTGVRRTFAFVSKLGDYSFWLMMGAVIFALQGPASLPAIGTMASMAGLGIFV